mgnify:CR=1 FL=1
MKRFFQIKTGSLFYKLLISFTLFLVIPIAVFTLLFQYNFIGYVKQQVSNSNMGNLAMVQGGIEAMLEGFTRDALRVSAGSSVRELTGITLDNYNKNTTRMNSIRSVYETLRGLENINQAIYSVYLYNSDEGYIISSKGEFNETKKFEDNGWISEYESHKASMRLLRPRVVVNAATSDNNLSQGSNLAGGDKVISLIYPIPLLTPNMEGAIVINIHESSLRKYSGSSDYKNQSTTFIIDREGYVISNEDKTRVGQNLSSEEFIGNILGNSADQTYFTARIEDRDYVVTYIKSKHNHWIYVSISPLDSLYKRVFQINTVMLIVSLLLMFAGLFLSFVISRQMYKPVKGILDTLKSKAIIDGENGQNELSILSGVVNKFIKDEELLNEELGQYQHSLKESYLLKLVKGEMEDGEKVNIFTTHNFCCLLFSIDRYFDFASNHTQEEIKYLKFILLKLCEEIVCKYIKCSGILLDMGKICIILNVDSNQDESLKSVIDEIYENIRKEVLGLNKVSLSLGIGGIYEGIDNIRKSYLEAEESLNYRLLFGNGSLIYHTALEKRTGDYYFPAVQAKHIQNCLSVNSYEGVEKVFNELTKEINEKDDLSYDNIMHIFYQLAGELVNFAISCYLKPSEIFEGENMLFKTLGRMETIDEIKEWMLQLYRKVILHREETENQNKKYIKEIVAAIHENYRRSDLDITFIASIVSLSYSHFRKIFKENMNCSFVDYVNNIRVNEAKKLLLGTDWTTEKIAEYIGFSNYQSFCRVFKKNEGVTPGKYKETSQEIDGAKIDFKQK